MRPTIVFVALLLALVLCQPASAFPGGRIIRGGRAVGRAVVGRAARIVIAPVRFLARPLGARLGGCAGGACGK